MTPFPTPLRRFVRLFNNGEFWESHEVLEGPWRAEGSRFYQGLILYASAYVHVQRANAHGVAAQLRKAGTALGPFAPSYLGVDVNAILARCRADEDAAKASPTPDDFKRWELPGLQLSTEHLRGDEVELTTRQDAGDRSG